jgi:hypothetical protein
VASWIQSINDEVQKVGSNRLSRSSIKGWRRWRIQYERVEAVEAAPQTVIIDLL